MVFDEFVGVKVEPGKPFIFNSGNHSIHYDISGIIGLAGEVLGLVIISFSKSVALKTVTKITGENIEIFDNIVIDSIGELINIIAGNSKKGLKRLES
jgi:chemotaxis protein CheX